MSTHPLLLGAFLVLASTVPAQQKPFTIFGEVARSGGGFVLEPVGVPLRGRAPLDRFVGEIVEVVGVEVGTAARPVVEVSSLKAAEDTFAIGGDSRIGGDVRLRLRSTRGVTYYIFLSFSRGFVPTDDRFPGSNLRGTFFLDLNRFILFGPGPLRGQWEERIGVPDVASLVGLRIWAQGAVGFADNSAAYVNADTTVLRER